MTHKIWHFPRFFSYMTGIGTSSRSFNINTIRRIKPMQHTPAPQAPPSPSISCSPQLQASAARVTHALSLSAHAVEGEPLGGLQRVEVAVAAHLLARLDQAAHAPRPAAPCGAPHAVHVVGRHGRPECRQSAGGVQAECR